VNIEAYGGPVAMVAVTAPGQDVLPWADSTRRKIEPQARWRWNRTAPARWRELHRRAAQLARRETGTFSLVAAEWEYQHRGALHRHVVLGMATAKERHAAYVYVQALDELRGRFGFGYVDRGRYVRGQGRRLRLWEPLHAARYLAKYLAPIDGAGKMGLTETVTQRDVPAHVTYVSRRLTMKTGCTMRALRLQRLVFMVSARLELDEGALWEMLRSGRKPSELIALLPARGTIP
jgi:hypothetical protein